MTLKRSVSSQNAALQVTLVSLAVSTPPFPYDFSLWLISDDH